MSVEVTARADSRRRRSVYVNAFKHGNPIPAACRVDNIVYSSIIHGIDRDKPETTVTLEAQAELMFARLRQIVEASGGSSADIVKVTMWMRDRADREAVNRFWLDMFPDASSRPARQTVNAQLDGGQLISCDFVAVIDKQHEQGDTRS